jgi:phage tail-like protein
VTTGPSSRGTVAGLTSAHPMGFSLPAVFQEDVPFDQLPPRAPSTRSFALRWCEGLDEVLAPVFLVLDCLAAYADPAIAPPDFVRWLAGWVGLDVDDTWDEARLRSLVADAVAISHASGTPEGLRRLVAAYVGAEPEIVEPGAVTTSATPGSPPGGSDDPTVVVRVPATLDRPVDVARLEGLVRRAVPAHLRTRVEVVPA